MNVFWRVNAIYGSEGHFVGSLSYLWPIVFLSFRLYIGVVWISVQTYSVECTSVEATCVILHTPLHRDCTSFIGACRNYIFHKLLFAILRAGHFLYPTFVLPLLLSAPSSIVSGRYQNRWKLVCKIGEYFTRIRWPWRHFYVGN